MASSKKISDLPVTALSVESDLFAIVQADGITKQATRVQILAALQAELDAHEALVTGNPHSVLHSDLSDKGSNDHAAIDSHVADGTIHFTEAAIDHGSIAGLADDDHTQYLNTTRHTAIGSNPHSVLHSELSDKGSNDHTAIDSHLGSTSNPHSVTKAQILSGDLVVNADVDASAAIAQSKLALSANLLALSGLAYTDGNFIVGNGATFIAESGATARTSLGLDVFSIVKSNLTASSAPGVGNDNTQGYGEGSIWVNATANEVYLCADAGTGAAVWKQIGSGGGGGTEFSDSLFRIQDNADDTKELAFEVSGITTGTTRTITVPDSDLVLNKNNLAGTVAPGTGDDSGDGYGIGSKWIDTVADKVYECTDATASAANWEDLTGAAGGGTPESFIDINAYASGAGSLPRYASDSWTGTFGGIKVYKHNERVYFEGGANHSSDITSGSLIELQADYRPSRTLYFIVSCATTSGGPPTDEGLAYISVDSSGVIACHKVDLLTTGTDINLNNMNFRIGVGGGSS